MLNAFLLCRFQVDELVESLMAMEWWLENSQRWERRPKGWELRS
jgi:hypothetical protein